MLNIPEKLYQCWIPPIVPSRQISEIVTPGIHHQNTAVDICSIIQSTALCHPLDLDVVLHLRHHRDASVWEYCSQP